MTRSKQSTGTMFSGESKLLLVTLVFFLLVHPTMVGAHQGTTLSVPPSASKVTLDASLDDFEWSDSAKISFRMPGALSDNLVYLKYEWPNQALVGAFSLVDASPANAQPNADAFFLFFDTKHNGGSLPQTDDFQVGMDRDSRTWVWKGDGNKWVDGSFTSSLPEPFSTIEMKAKTVALGGGLAGWVGEFRITLTAKTPPIMGFVITQIDQQENSRVSVKWPTGAGASTPSSWADITFTGPQQPQVITKEVIKEVPKEIVKEVVKEVPVEVIKEVPKEVIKEVPVEVIKEVPKEVVKEVPKEVIKEVPKEVVKTVTIETISPLSYAVGGLGLFFFVAGIVIALTGRERLKQTSDPAGPNAGQPVTKGGGFEPGDIVLHDGKIALVKKIRKDQGKTSYDVEQ